jgi:hypothetical protein
MKRGMKQLRVGRYFSLTVDNIPQAPNWGQFRLIPANSGLKFLEKYPNIPTPRPPTAFRHPLSGRLKAKMAESHQNKLKQTKTHSIKVRSPSRLIPKSEVPTHSNPFARVAVPLRPWTLASDFGPWTLDLSPISAFRIPRLAAPTPSRRSCAKAEASRRRVRVPPSHSPSTPFVPDRAQSCRAAANPLHIGCWLFDVRCWMFPRPSMFSVRRSAFDVFPQSRYAYKHEKTGRSLPLGRRTEHVRPVEHRHPR